jgi:uncharacterized protein
MLFDGDGLRVLDAEECRVRLENHPVHVGRIAFVSDGFPVVLPVNYQLMDGEVIFRTGIGSKLDQALRGAAISFEVDAVDPAWEEGWSVLVKGKAEELHGEELARARRRTLRPWGPGAKPRYLRIRTEQMTGRQIV